MKCSIVKLAGNAVSLCSQEGQSETTGDAAGFWKYNSANPDFGVMMLCILYLNY
ncbi:MAG: hypothetical protein ACUVUH_04300 [bacterium]